jgi:hypothetical protein
VRVTRVSWLAPLIGSPSTSRAARCGRRRKVTSRPASARDPPKLPRHSPLRLSTRSQELPFNPVGHGTDPATVKNTTVGIDMLQSHVECQRDALGYAWSLPAATSLHGGEYQRENPASRSTAPVRQEPALTCRSNQTYFISPTPWLLALTFAVPMFMGCFNL